MIIRRSRVWLKLSKTFQAISLAQGIVAVPGEGGAGRHDLPGATSSLGGSDRGRADLTIREQIIALAYCKNVFRLWVLLVLVVGRVVRGAELFANPDTGLTLR